MEVRLLCSFYHESLHTWIKTIANKFAISNRMALILGVHALRSYLKLIFEYELHSLPNEKLMAQRIMVKTTSRSDRPWSSHLSRDRLFAFIIKTLLTSRNCQIKLQLHDAIYRLRFCSNSLIHILSISNSHNLASIQKNRGDKSHRVIVGLLF